LDLRLIEGTALERIFRVGAGATTLAACGALFGFSSLFDDLTMSTQAVIALTTAIVGALAGGAVAASMVGRPNWPWIALSTLAMYGCLMIDNEHRQDASTWFVVAVAIGAVLTVLTFIAERTRQRIAAVSLSVVGATLASLGLGLGILGYPLLLVPFGLWLLSAAVGPREAQFAW